MVLRLHFSHIAEAVIQSDLQEQLGLIRVKFLAQGHINRFIT